MKNFLLFVFCIFISVIGYAQNITIDDFSTEHTVRITAMGPRERSASFAGGGVLGGERDVVHAKTVAVSQTGETLAGTS